MLVIHSKAGKIVPSSQLRRLARKTGEHVQLVELDPCSHFDVPMNGYLAASKWLQQAAFPGAETVKNAASTKQQAPHRVTKARAVGRSVQTTSMSVNPYVN